MMKITEARKILKEIATYDDAEIRRKCRSYNLDKEEVSRNKIKVDNYDSISWNDFFDELMKDHEGEEISNLYFEVENNNGYYDSINSTVYITATYATTASIRIMRQRLLTHCTEYIEKYEKDKATNTKWKKEQEDRDRKQYEILKKKFEKTK